MIPGQTHKAGHDPKKWTIKISDGYIVKQEKCKCILIFYSIDHVGHAKYYNAFVYYNSKDKLRSSRGGVFISNETEFRSLTAIVAEMKDLLKKWFP